MQTSVFLWVTKTHSLPVFNYCIILRASGSPCPATVGSPGCPQIAALKWQPAQNPGLLATHGQGKGCVWEWSSWHICITNVRVFDNYDQPRITHRRRLHCAGSSALPQQVSLSVVWTGSWWILDVHSLQGEMARVSSISIFRAQHLTEPTLWQGKGLNITDSSHGSQIRSSDKTWEEMSPLIPRPILFPLVSMYVCIVPLCV